VLGQIERWASLGLSLRQMQAEIGGQMATQVGLRKLNEIVQAVVPAAPMTFTSVPPIILLDAIWLTLLTATERVEKDRLGRRRGVKAGHKVCVLVALGLYPQTGRWGILGWELAESESQSAWEQLLLALEKRGVYRERGVELFIHDGGKGLIAALDLIYAHIPHQRCLFHKLRNLAHAIDIPTGLSRQQAHDFKRALLEQVSPLLAAETVTQAQHLRDALCLQWQDTQPRFVATLQRDWHETIAFFRVLTHFPDWPRTALRTTSLLERLNRRLRRLFRPAGAYHSRSGLLATVARILIPVQLI
jgi:transposase-like protein